MTEMISIGEKFRYDVPAERVGNDPNSVIGRGLESYSHDPAALRQRIEAALDKEVAPIHVEATARLGEIGVADTVAKPSEADLRLEALRQEYIASGIIKPDEYWDDAPNNLAPVRNNAYTNIPAPVADRFNPEAYVGQAPVLPNPSK